MPRRKKKTKWTTCPDCGGDGDCGDCDGDGEYEDAWVVHDEDCGTRRGSHGCCGDCYIEAETKKCGTCYGSGKCTRCKGKGTVPLYPGRRR